MRKNPRRRPAPPERRGEDEEEDETDEDDESPSLEKRVPSNMEELGRILWVFFTLGVFVILAFLGLTLIWLFIQACCVMRVFPFLKKAGGTVVGAATEVVFGNTDDGSWPSTVLTPGLIRRGTRLFVGAEDTEMMITGWAEGSQGYIVRLGIADYTLASRFRPPLLAAELVDPEDLTKKKLLVPKHLTFRIPENYPLPEIDSSGLDVEAAPMLKNRVRPVISTLRAGQKSTGVGTPALGDRSKHKEGKNFTT